MLKKYHISEKMIALISLIFLLAVNYIVVKDYGISIDEESTRFHGLVSLNYILNFLNINNTSIFSENIPNLKSYEYKEYGVFFEIFLILITEVIFNIKEFSNIFFVRHFITHSFFILSVICFYYLAVKIFSNKFSSYLSSIVLYTTPRIFGESFYNNKDIIFLAFFIFSIFFIIKFFEKTNIKNAILAALFIALLINIRVIGVYLSLVVVFILFNDLVSSKKLRLKEFKLLFIFLIFNLLFVYIFWPFLWESPISNFLSAISSFTKYAWGGSILYLGEFHSAKYLPWHYLFIWIIATSPIYLIIIIFSAYVFYASKYVKSFLKLDQTDVTINIWRNNDDKKIFLIFLISIVPIFLYLILSPVIYNGWRHFYFLYPCFILISLKFYQNLIDRIKKNTLRKILYIFILTVPIVNFYNLVKFHPFQYVYFNKIFEDKANNLFEIDYWGVANSYTLEKNFNNKKNSSDKFKIATGSFTNLTLSKKMLNFNLQNKLQFTGQNYDDSDFIFTNNNFASNPKYDKKFIYPLHFDEFYLLKRGNILINKIYKKNVKN